MPCTASLEEDGGLVEDGCHGKPAATNCLNLALGANTKASTQSGIF